MIPTTPRAIHKPVASGSFPLAAPMTPPSPVLTPGQLSRTWSIGSIPIYFDPSTPTLNGDKATFPCSASLESSPVKRDSGLDSSPSALARRNWKGRQDSLRQGVGGIWGESKAGRVLNFDDERYHRVGLNIIDASPPPKSHFTTQSMITPPSPTTPSSQNSSYLTTGDEESEVLTDNDDALSCFSLSAYLTSGSVYGDKYSDEESEREREMGERKVKAMEGESRSSSEFGREVSSKASSSTAPQTPRQHTRAKSALKPPNLDFTPEKFQLPVVQLAVPAVNFSRPLNARVDPTNTEPETPIVFSYSGSGSELSPTPSEKVSYFSPHQTWSTPKTVLRESLSENSPLNIVKSTHHDHHPASTRGRLRSASVASSSAGSHSRRDSISSQNLNLPADIAFLKDTVVELWIDQVFILPHRYYWRCLTIICTIRRDSGRLNPNWSYNGMLRQQIRALKYQGT